VTAEDSTEAGEIPAEAEAPKSKFAPIQWVAPVPEAKAAAPETNGKAADAEAATSDGEASAAADKPLSEMTEVEKILARAKKYGTPVDQKLLAAAKLAERAKRFNIEPVAAAKGVLQFHWRNLVRTNCQPGWLHIQMLERLRNRKAEQENRQRTRKH
jgi:hypothetical protein